MLPLLACAAVAGGSAARLRAQFLANGGLAVTERALPADGFERVRTECRRLRARVKPEVGSIAQGRLGCHVPAGTAIADELLGPDMCSRVGALLGEPVAPRDFPVELRVYPKGASMPPHSDTLLFTRPHVELVLTVDNDSDSETRWRGADGALHGRWLPPNSLLVVLAGGCEHAVTPSTRGERLILKALLAPTSECAPAVGGAFEVARRVYRGSAPPAKAARTGERQARASRRSR